MYCGAFQLVTITVSGAVESGRRFKVQQVVRGVLQHGAMRRRSAGLREGAGTERPPARRGQRGGAAGARRCAGRARGACWAHLAWSCTLSEATQ